MFVQKRGPFDPSFKSLIVFVTSLHRLSYETGDKLQRTTFLELWVIFL